MTFDDFKSKLALRPGGRGCHDLDPDWPGDNGQRRGPRVCVLYPSCPCGKEDETAAKAKARRTGAKP